MSTIHAQIWKGSTFTIERSQDPAAYCLIFRFSGPFTARDMYSSLTPAALRNIFDVRPSAPRAVGKHLRPHRCPLHGLLRPRPARETLRPLPEQGIQLIAAGVNPRVLALQDHPGRASVPHHRNGR
jgi:hypothetical protein